MNNIFFIADTHFNHDKIRVYCNRPFQSMQEADEIIIDNWNKVVKPGDIIYHLGDFAYGAHEIVSKYRHRLMGKIHLIFGNHDYRNRIHNLKHLFSSTNDILEIQYNHQPIILCHYAMRVWGASHYNSIQLYGHSHGKLEGIGKQMDVGVDCNDFTPIHIDKIIEIMKNKPDNFNLLKKGDMNVETTKECDLPNKSRE